MSEDSVIKKDHSMSTSYILREIAMIAIPSSISQVSQMLLEIINLIFIGHLGDANLVAAVGMGNLWINITGLSIVIGLN